MSKYSCTFNAEIEKAEILFERGFILTAWVYLKWEGSEQGCGGYVLGGSPFDATATCAKHDEQANLAADFIGGMMGVAGVERWSQMAGKIVRVGKSDKWGDILALGHAVKDCWYEPATAMNTLAKRTKGTTKIGEGA